MKVPGWFPFIGAATGMIVLLGGIYTVVTKAGYVIGASQAQTIAQAEVKGESVERMEFQLEYKLSELRRYYAIPEADRTPADRVQIEELQKQIAFLQERLKEARGY